jgi:hypothetical protein
MQADIHARADLEYYRKAAKALVRAHRAGDTRALTRAAAVIGPRALERFLLADALHVIAREHGRRSWPEFKQVVENMRGKSGLSALPDGDEALVPTGLAYAGEAPVLVFVRRRGRRFDIDDRGAAVERAGAPPGWLLVAEEAVARHALNVNRRGVVFVQVVEGRDLERLVQQVAEASLAVHSALLELEEGEPRTP